MRPGTPVACCAVAYSPSLTVEPGSRIFIILVAAAKSPAGVAIFAAWSICNLAALVSSKPSTSVSGNTELQIPVTTSKSPVVKSNAVKNKKVVKKTSSSRQEEIASLNDQLQFAKVELSAQIDLLNVIVDTNVFGTDTQNAAPAQIASLKAITTDGGNN